MKEIAAVELENLLSLGKEVNIIDVREADEVVNGKIPGSIHIPLGLIEFRMADLDKTKEYIVVCHAGGRSSRAVQFLESYGFNVINMSGGMLSWEGEVD
ncbi:rhodanese-like domain-containing protein [Bacillus sp. EAC]|uniref:rhodanese-like domain-containing protein n=1 Tax=Bacillus sp. EAC TaxID=1978338 RepID=UPI000B439775|nr:rhodanese-like domain-containing protein [Bacillus sp. EAC]